MVHNGHIPMFTSEPEAVSFSPWPRTQCNLCASPSEPRRQQAALQTTSNSKAAILLLSSTATLHTCYKLKLFSSSYQHTTQNLPYSSSRSGCSAYMSTLPFFWKEILNLLFVVASWQCRIPHRTSRSLVNYCDHSLPCTSCRTPR